MPAPNDPPALPPEGQLLRRLTDAIHSVKYLLSAYYMPDAKDTRHSHEHCLYIVNIPSSFLVALCHISQTVSMQNLLDKEI